MVMVGPQMVGAPFIAFSSRENDMDNHETLEYPILQTRILRDLKRNSTGDAASRGGTPGELSHERHLAAATSTSCLLQGFALLISCGLTGPHRCCPEPAPCWRTSRLEASSHEFRCRISTVWVKIRHPKAGTTQYGVISCNFRKVQVINKPTQISACDQGAHRSTKP